MLYNSTRDVVVERSHSTSMGSILCRSSAHRESSPATLSLRDPHTRRSSRNKKSIFHPLQNTCFAQDNDCSEKQERFSLDVHSDSPRVTSKEPDTRLRRKNCRSLSPTAKEKLYDPTMDDTTPLIEGTKDPTSDFPSSNEMLWPMNGEDSVEQLISDCIFNQGDLDNSVPDNVKDDIVPMKCGENDSRLTGGSSRSTKHIREKRKKRRASRSPLLSSESFNTKDIPTHPKAPVPAFFPDEISFSPTISSSAPSGASRDQDLLHNIPVLHEKATRGRKAKAANNTEAASSEREVMDPGSPSVLRLPPTPVAISVQPVQRPLRATAPIFVPKPVRMGYPSSFTPIKANPTQTVNHHIQPKPGSDRIVRLDPNATGIKVSPSIGLGGPRAREMYHWSPSMSSAFQVPRFTSWEMMSEPCDPRCLGLTVDTSAPVSLSLEEQVMQHSDGKTHHFQHPAVQSARVSLVQGSASNSNNGHRTSKRRPMPNGTVQAAPVFPRKSPQVRGEIASASPVASSRPTIFHYRGTKITMIDERRKVFVIDLLSKETCELIQTVSRVSACLPSVFNL